MDFDQRARDELHHLEEAFGQVDPDEVEVDTAEGVLKLQLKDGTRIVINSHRAAGQIWMAAISTAWHFDPTPDGGWKASRTGEELRPTLAKLVRERTGVTVAL